MITLLGNLFGLASLVCWILVLIKHFQNKQILHGVIGILTCSLWSFIWGWVTQAKFGLKKIMLIWTVCFIASMILGGLSFSSNMAKIKASAQESLDTVPELPVAE